jgi:hypothetical protein
MESKRRRGRPKVDASQRRKQLYFSGRPDIYETFKFCCDINREDPNIALEKLMRNYISEKGNSVALKEHLKILEAEKKEIDHHMIIVYDYMERLEAAKKKN